MREKRDNQNNRYCGIDDIQQHKNIMDCGGTGQPEFGSLDFQKMVQLIMENDSVFNYLIYYFIDWISDKAFEEYAEEEIKKGKSLRQVHAEYFAAWIPWEPCAEQIIVHIHELAKDE